MDNDKEIIKLEVQKKVRVGSMDDFEDVLRLSNLHLKEANISPIDYDWAESTIKKCLSLEGGISGLIGRGDKLEGYILLEIFKPYPYKCDFLNDMGLFVHPDFRKGGKGNGRLLLEFSKKTASELKLPLFCGLRHGNRLPAKMKLYENSFSKPIACLFLEVPESVKNDGIS